MSAPAAPRFQPGALVHARGRDWVVLPPDPDDPELLLLRPLGGTDDDAAGLYLPLEGQGVHSATLPPPDPRYVGDAVSARLLRDAVRLGFRSAAGPLRCLGRIAVQPRPYQLVPLLMALRHDPIRLLIGDDVGIGKTIEAALIARELLDRGEIRRICVLCSPQLCEQWQSELSSKFHIEAEVVRPGTVARLERRLEREGRLDLSHTLFEEYPFTVVSIDYIKSDRRRADFVRTCPELIIVDEAHTVAEPGGRSGAQHQRHALVAELAEDPRRHVILATATPHSGDQDAFASLVGLLAPDLAQAVATLEYGAGTEARERLARHFVQRRRADIKRYLNAETDFPERLVAEQTYKLSPPYRSLLERVVAHARQLVRDAASGSAFQQRISWWAALALLRCVSSSPAAAAAALRARAPRPETGEDVQAVNRMGAAAVLDLDQQDDAAGADSTPGADITPDLPSPVATGEGEGEGNPDRAYLLRLAREAEALMGDGDPKLAKAIEIVQELLRAGFRPIVFCRYIATAHYVGEALRKRLRSATVEIVTGELPPEDRDSRVQALDGANQPVLVATDCLSEGVNLQHIFDAAVHYDLAWNPTRHEQREGRVDRYGQTSPEVRTVLLYGQDNRVDGVVLEVLLRKAELIRKTLGVSVPVPADTDKILEAIFDKLFDRPGTDYQQLELFVTDQQHQLDSLWRAAEEREKRTRTVFAQYALKPEEVRAELDEALAAVGTAEDVRWFVEDAFTRLAHKPAPVPPSPAAAGEGRGEGLLDLDLSALPPVLRSRLPDAVGQDSTLRAGFEPAVPKGATYLPRTHPLIETIGSYLLDTALDEPEGAKAARTGAMRTAAVKERTVLLLLRARYIISETRQGETRELLGEEALLTGFRGSPEEPRWLEQDEAERLAREARPVANVLAEQAQSWAAQMIDSLPEIEPALNALAQRRAQDLLASHTRVRAAAALRGVRQQVEAKLPLDVLGLYILMPPMVGA